MNITKQGAANFAHIVLKGNAKGLLGKMKGRFIIWERKD